MLGGAVTNWQNRRYEAHAGGGGKRVVVRQHPRGRINRGSPAPGTCNPEPPFFSVSPGLPVGASLVTEAGAGLSGGHCRLRGEGREASPHLRFASADCRLRRRGREEGSGFQVPGAGEERGLRIGALPEPGTWHPEPPTTAVRPFDREACADDEAGAPGGDCMYWIPDPEQPLTRVCTRCSEEKHLMEFYLRFDRGRRRRDCKACGRARYRRWTAANAVRCRERAREWARRHPERVRETQRRYRLRHGQRNLVRHVSRGLWKLGLIEVADRCAECGGGPVELHHPDYGDVYRVVPLCRRCHSRRHFAEWRRVGGGPVKYPEEYRGMEEQEQALRGEAVGADPCVCPGGARESGHTT